MNQSENEGYMSRVSFLKGWDVLGASLVMILLASFKFGMLLSESRTGAVPFFGVEMHG